MSTHYATSIGATYIGVTGGASGRWNFPAEWQPPETSVAVQTSTHKEKKSMLEEMRAYVREYRSVLFTLGIVLIVDHLFLGGALRARVHAALSGLIDKAENSLGVGHHGAPQS